MSAKILISSLANSGKTTLLSKLQDVLVVAHDGKSYPFPQPHVEIDGFDSVTELTSLILEKIGQYKEKFGSTPKTVAIDSVSRVFETIANTCNVKHTGFNIYTELNKEVKLFTDFIERKLVANNVNVVLVSHALFDADTGRYTLVAQGSFAKTGGFLSVVDNAVFLETKGNKRLVHHRNPKLASRTILDELPDNQPVEEYDLQKHIDLLVARKGAVAEFKL